MATILCPKNAEAPTVRPRVPTRPISRAAMKRTTRVRVSLIRAGGRARSYAPEDEEDEGDDHPAEEPRQDHRPLYVPRAQGAAKPTVLAGRGGTLSSRGRARSPSAAPRRCPRRW